MKGLRKKLAMLGAVSAVSVAMAAQQAQAIPTFKISDGITTIEIADGDALDTAGQAGVVGYSGSIGNFALNFVTGLTKPAIGTQYRPLMDIVSVNSTWLGNGGGTLTIMMTETDFIPLDNGMRNYSFHSSIGGTTEGTVSYQTFLDEGNNPYGMTTALANLDTMTGTPFAFSDDDSHLYRPQNNYSLTMVITIDHSDANQNTSFNAELRGIPNPEPVTGALSIMSLGALTAAMRRRRTA